MLGAGRGRTAALRLVTVQLAVDFLETLAAPVGATPVHASLSPAPSAPHRCAEHSEDEEEEEQREEKTEESEAEAPTEEGVRVVVPGHGRPRGDLCRDVLRNPDLVSDHADDGEHDQRGDGPCC